MATWKKIIVSGSNAEFTQVSASTSISIVGGNQIIASQANTKLSGSFTGSFTGDGTGLTGVTATPSFPTTATTNLTSTDKFFVNDDVGDATSGNKKITYANLLTDLAGTNLAVESSDSLTLASSITGISNFQSTSITGSTITGSFTGSFGGTFTGAINSNNGILSGSSLSSPAQGQVRITTNGVAQSAVDLGLEAGDTPTFAGIASNGATFGIATSTATTINIGTTDATNVSIGKSGTSTVNVNNNLVVTGDLTVNGTTTTVDTTNLLVEDKFALFASGSDTNTDGGIVVQQADSTGYALGVDASADRWALQNNASPTTTTITPDAFVGVIQEGTAAPVSNPVYGGANGNGTLFINTLNGDIWIYG